MFVALGRFKEDCRGLEEVLVKGEGDARASL